MLLIVRYFSDKPWRGACDERDACVEAWRNGAGRCLALDDFGDCRTILLFALRMHALDWGNQRCVERHLAQLLGAHAALIATTEPPPGLSEAMGCNARCHIDVFRGRRTLFFDLGGRISPMDPSSRR